MAKGGTLLTTKAERLANQLIGVAAGHQGRTAVVGLTMALIYVLEDPHAPPKPRVMEDMLGICKQLVAEAVSFDEQERRSIAEKWIKGQIDVDLLGRSEG